MLSSKIKNASNVVGRYTIDVNSNTSFNVVLKENLEGFREFEIILSQHGSDDYNEVYSHPFYNNFVIPWSYKQKELEVPKINLSKDNVINLNDFRNKNERFERNI